MSTSSSTAPWSFRRRIGRAASPPTWACYEQIPDDYYEEEYSDDDSCSEDEDSYQRDHDRDHDRSDDEHEHMVMDMDVGPDDEDSPQSEEQQLKKDVKGKQRAVEDKAEGHVPKSPSKVGGGGGRHKKERPVYTLRPILTIQKSQGFVWNQDLFVPPYIKDRYIASTSPSNSMGLISSSVSSTNSTLDGYGNYEVEVVEIRVTKDDLSNIIP